MESVERKQIVASLRAGMSAGVVLAASEHAHEVAVLGDRAKAVEHELCYLGDYAVQFEVCEKSLTPEDLMTVREPPECDALFR